MPPPGRTSSNFRSNEKGLEASGPSTTAPRCVHGRVRLAVYVPGMAVPAFALAAEWDGLTSGAGAGCEVGCSRSECCRYTPPPLWAGVLFVALGAVFLAFDGTSALPPQLHRARSRARSSG